MKLLGSLFILLGLTFCHPHYAFAQETSTSAGVRHHVQNVMSEYDNWLSANEDADPTPLTPVDSIIGESIYESLFRLTYYLKYEQMLGYVQNIKSRCIEDISVDLIKLQLSIAVNTTGEIVFQGNYTATGSLTTGRPLSGYGAWNLTCSSLHQVFYISFDLTSEGFVSFKNSRPSVSVTLDVDTEKTYFEALWDNGAGGFAPEIQKAMSLELRERYQSWYEGHPSASLLLRYLNETLPTTSLEEMMGTKEPATEPPPTTEAPSTSPPKETEPTEPPTTAPPQTTPQDNNPAFTPSAASGLLLVALLTHSLL